MRRLGLLLLCCAAAAPSLFSSSVSPEQRQTLYHSLDERSVQQLFAFYDLYSDTQEGREALLRGWKLLSTTGLDSAALPRLPQPDIADLVATLVSLQARADLPQLEESALAAIETLGQPLANRRLLGHEATREEEVLELPPEEIDLARALLISQLGEAALPSIRTYEALLDLMALQIQARLPESPSPEDKIRAMNRFIFHDMHFRFPPHSSYSSEIDLYTFLPAVLDSRRGVCLGVSILYLALAQRLDLPLEIVTPPGHIYIRYRHKDTCINIETTARGIDLPTEVYLGIHTKSLPPRSLKEVIGMAYINQAAAFSQAGRFPLAVAAYERGQPYLAKDPLLLELMAYHCLMAGYTERGKRLLEEALAQPIAGAVVRDTLGPDFLNGDADEECVKAIFQHVDETSESLQAKKASLEKALQKSPRCRAALFHLATTWLQLHRPKEALSVLQRFHLLYSEDPVVEYYLAALSAERYDYLAAWAALQRAEALTAQAGHFPLALRELRRSLRRACAEPHIL